VKNGDIIYTWITENLSIFMLQIHLYYPREVLNNLMRVGMFNRNCDKLKLPIDSHAFICISVKLSF